MEASENPWSSTLLALYKFQYDLGTTNLLELHKMMLCHAMSHGRITSQLTFEIQTFRNKHLNEATNGLMSPRGSYIDA